MFTFIFFHALEGKEIVVQEAVAVNTMVDIGVFFPSYPFYIMPGSQERKKRGGGYK